MRKDVVDELLNFDAIDTAEKITGETGPSILGLSLGMMQLKQKILKSQLKGKDTYFNMTWQEFKDLMADNVIGFTNVLLQKFKGRNDHDKGSPQAPDEEWGCWFNEQRGLIIFAGSYTSFWDKEKKEWHVSLNNGEVYFQYEMTQKVYHDTEAWKNVLDHTSGGTYLKSNPHDRIRDLKDDELLVFERSLDIREALIHKLLNLDLGPGKWIAPWVDCSYNDRDGKKVHRHIWPLNYMEVDANKESEGFGKFDTAIAAKIELLPQAVRKVMGF